MIRSNLRRLAVGVGVVMLFATSIAEAQWVMLARRAVGRVEQMSQQNQGNGASYDTAAVVLEVPADKVYAAVVRGVGSAEGIRITSQTPGERMIQFTNGTQVAGIKVSPLGDDLTHLLITSAHTGSQANAATLVMNSVLRVCKEMNVECTPAKQ
jgi:hypothetical protein